MNTRPMSRPPGWFARSPLTARLAVLAWAALLAGVGVRVAASHPWSQSVVPVYLYAGQQWAAGADVYAPNVYHDAYRNPPHVAPDVAGVPNLELDRAEACRDVPGSIVGHRLG